MFCEINACIGKAPAFLHKIKMKLSQHENDKKIITLWTEPSTENTLFLYPFNIFGGTCKNWHKYNKLTGKNDGHMYFIQEQNECLSIGAFPCSVVVFCRAGVFFVVLFFPMAEKAVIWWRKTKKQLKEMNKTI